MFLLEHEEKVWVPLQEVGVQLLGGLNGFTHSTRQHQLLDLYKPTVESHMKVLNATVNNLHLQ